MAWNSGGEFPRKVLEALRFGGEPPRKVREGLGIRGRVPPESVGSPKLWGVSPPGKSGKAWDSGTEFPWKAREALRFEGYVSPPGKSGKAWRDCAVVSMADACGGSGSDPSPGDRSEFEESPLVIAASSKSNPAIRWSRPGKFRGPCFEGPFAVLQPPSPASGASTSGSFDRPMSTLWFGTARSCVYFFLRG